MVLDQVTPWSRACKCMAVRSLRKKSLADICVHIKCRWLWEIATANYWQGSEALCFLKQDWCTTWFLLLDQCKGLDDCKDLSRVVAGVGLDTKGQMEAYPPATGQLFQTYSIPPSEGITNIQIENFAPNLTAHLQPMDQGIIKCFKVHYQAGYIQHSINNYKGGVTPSNIYNIDQLDVMRLANHAWLEVDATTIQHCWDKSGILPDTQHTTSLIQPTLPISSLLHHQEDPISVAKNQVINLLDELENTGALQHSNWMGLLELLNPANEAHGMDKVTDKDIFDAVMEAREQEMEWHNDIGADTMANAEPTLTHTEVLQVTLCSATLQRTKMTHLYVSLSPCWLYSGSEHRQTVWRWWWTPN